MQASGRVQMNTMVRAGEGRECSGSGRMGGSMRRANGFVGDWGVGTPLSAAVRARSAQWTPRPWVVSIPHTGVAAILVTFSPGKRWWRGLHHFRAWLLQCRELQLLHHHGQQCGEHEAIHHEADFGSVQLSAMARACAGREFCVK